LAFGNGILVFYFIFMSIFQAIILGVVQGFGEFLPISSSGHLVLVPWFFNWDDPGLAFDVALHFGTLAAVVIYFRRDLLSMIKAFFSRTGEADGYTRKFVWLLAAATAPGALAGYFFESQAENVFRNPLLVAAALALVGFFLYLADRFSRDEKTVPGLSFKDALWIGLSQAVAIMPGVSRSGATISASRALGFKREDAARFSFLLSIPIIFGAALVKAGDFFAAGIGAAEIAGISSAALSGYLAIAGLLRLVKKSSYGIFFWYRLALALAIAAFFFFR